MSGFEIGPVRVESVVDKVALTQIFLRVVWFTAVCTRWRSWLRHSATSRKGSLGFLIHLILPAAL
jgi:hypothetical protein